MGYVAAIIGGAIIGCLVMCLMIAAGKEEKMRGSPYTHCINCNTPTANLDICDKCKDLISKQFEEDSMQDLNKVILMGKPTRDPETVETKDGKRYAKFSLEVRRGGSGGGTDYFTIIAWDKAYDQVISYVHAGEITAIVGRLRSRKWEENGFHRTEYEVAATEVYAFEV